MIILTTTDALGTFVADETFDDLEALERDLELTSTDEYRVALIDDLKRGGEATRPNGFRYIDTYRVFPDGRPADGDLI
jgi:hypothetical protein